MIRRLHTNSVQRKNPKKEKKMKIAMVAFTANGTLLEKKSNPVCRNKGMKFLLAQLPAMPNPMI
jgi:hypothetical protein